MNREVKKTERNNQVRVTVALKMTKGEYTELKTALDREIQNMEAQKKEAEAQLSQIPEIPFTGELQLLQQQLQKLGALEQRSKISQALNQLTKSIKLKTQEREAFDKSDKPVAVKKGSKKNT